MCYPSARRGATCPHDTGGMGVAVVIDRSETQVVPGQRTSSSVRIRNTGSVVDEFVLDVVGDAAAWTEVEPRTVNLMPGEESTAQIVFNPPRTSRVVEGQVPFALRVVSREDIDGSAIQEAVVEVGPFSQFTGELLPRTSTGRRGATHQLVIDNLGNHPELMTVLATDDDLKLDFRIEPANVTMAPGTATFVKVRVKPKRTFLRGPNVTIPFQVAAAPAEGEPIILQGNLLQRSILPSWFFKALALLAVAAIALTVLWLTVLRPTVQATARQAAQDENAAVAKKADQAAAAADQASADAAAAQSQSSAAAADAAQAGKKVDNALKPGGKIDQASQGGTTATLDTTAAVDRRLAVEAASGATASETFGPPKADDTLWITDLLLMNPAGDTGTLRIKRGDVTLLTFGLQNFRDQDYHFIQPAQFTQKDPVVVEVVCRNETDACSPSVYLGGQVVSPPPPKKNP